ncbi:MAG: glycosyltransferase family 4 protein [Eubacteriales bacterium]|nr:glycosyltransferase family 4 protein [Eubacteriales bacterium]
MSKKPRHPSILHLTDYGAPYEGNFVASLRALELRLQTDECEMFCVFPRRTGDTDWANRMVRENSNVYIIEKEGFFAYFHQIRRILKESQADILHEHFIHYKEKIAALLACATCGHRVKIVLHLHNHLAIPKDFFRALPQRMYLAFVSRFVCCSRSVASHLISDGVSKERVCIAENAIAFERLDTFVPLSKSEIGTCPEDRVAMMFGFDYLRKGVDLAVEAVRSLRASGENITLAIVLSSRREQVEQAILAQLHETCLPSWVLLLPPRSDVGSYYRLADLFFSPSREEGFCYSLVEAAYCQTPVLASAIDAQKDLALPEESFFDPNDEEALARAIRRTLNEPDSPDKADALALARERVIQTYSLTAWADTVVKIYSGLF